MVSVAAASVKKLRVNPLAIVSHPQPKVPPVIVDFHLYTFRVCVAEGIAQRLAGDPIDRVYSVVAQAVRAIDFVLINGEFASRWVEVMQTNELAAEPECSVAVLDQFQVEKSALCSRLINVLNQWNREPGKLLCQPVESIKELIASDPKRAITVLEEGTNGHSTEAVRTGRLNQIRLSFLVDSRSNRLKQAVTARKQPAL